MKTREILTFLLLSAACCAWLSSCHGPDAEGADDAGGAEVATWEQFSGERAFAHVQAMVAMGPRPSGSPELETCRRYLEAEFQKAGWVVRRQTFEDDTPRGRVVFHNLRARFPGGDTWARPVKILAGSHYDTKWFEGVEFVGANDAGSSTGLLLELARVAALSPEFARSLELVCFDGEEAVVAFTNTDGLYGSRHYAREVREWPPHLKPKFGIIFDMVGDADLRIEIPPNHTSPRLRQAAFAAADSLGYNRHFGIQPNVILDDHVPLAAQAGIEMTNFIDFTYAPWHTAGDTLDKISAQSLEITGRTALLMLQRHLPE